MLEKTYLERKSDLVFEFGTDNGVLCTLSQNSFKKFYMVECNSITHVNTIKNLEKHNVSKERYWLGSNMYNSFKCIHKAVEENGSDSRFTLVFHCFKNQIQSFQKNISKYLSQKTLYFKFNTY
jgi:hypothetical protein